MSHSGNIEGFDPDLLKEGDEIARRFYREQGSKRFNLEMEAFCKKIWKPWFDAGHWVWTDLTQPQTAEFQIEEKPWPEDVKKDVRIYLSTLRFPHDFDISRINESWYGDYKFKPNTRQGIWVEKEDYDKYHALGVPNFLLFIWANDEKKRLIHKIQDPSKYGSRFYDETEYYDVTKACIEPPKYDVPIKSPIPLGLKDYWAFRFRIDALASEGFYPEEIVPTPLDYEKAERLFNENVSLVEATDIPRRMLDKEIEKIEGWDVQVMKTKKPHKRMEKVSILGFDTEFHEDRLLSVQFAVPDKTGKLKSKCITEKLEGYDTQRLIKDVLDFMLECGIEPYNRIYLIAHFSAADLEHLANCLRDFKFREINRAMHAEFVVSEDANEKEFASKEFSLGDFKLKIIDLFAYYPAALKKVGGMIRLPKREVDREHILDLFNNRLEKFREYAVRDAEIALKAFLNLRDSLWKYKVELLRCPSIASIASDIFRINYLHKYPAPVTFTTEYQSYRTKKGEWPTRRVSKTRYAERLDLRKMALKCYWGGRAECYVHGLIKGDFKFYDVVSLYPSCAMLQPVPNKDTKWIEIGTQNFGERALEGFVCVEFEFLVNTRYPCLPVHGLLNNRLYFPLKGVSFCTMSEVREAIRLGCKIKSIHGYGFRASEGEINHDLATFMKDMLKLKAQSPKESLEYETYKLIASALVGKLAQRRAEDNLDYAQQLFVAHGVPLEHGFKGRVKAGSTWAPEWASLILGKARALMSQFINKGALMTVTDSVLLPNKVNTKCDALKELKTVGSDLVAEPYEIASALIVRSKLYALMDKKGEIIKEAHHAVHLDSSQVKEIFKKTLEAGYDLDLEGNRDHLVRLREALQKRKPLGYAELKPSKIYFRWYWKRNLDNPNLNMFREYSDTKPIKDVVEFENDLFEVMKHQRAKTKRGRPREYEAELVDKVKELKEQGKSYREIAKTLGVSLGKVQRILAKFPGKN